MSIVIRKASKIARKVKVCLYGEHGTGKTFAALSFPRLLVVDTEHGSDLYGGRADIPDFDVTHIKTLGELDELVTRLEKDAGQTWETLVIDSVTVLHAVQKGVVSRNNTRPIDFQGWTTISNRFNSLYIRLVSLPINVVIVAREAIEYDNSDTTSGLKRIGVKPDADKNLVYMMDFVVRLLPDHSAIVEKSRGQQLSEDSRLPSVSWSAFESVADEYASGDTVEFETDEEAAERELGSFENRDTVEAWVKEQESRSLTIPNLLEALGGIQKFSEWKGGRKAADVAVQKWIDTAATAEPATPTYGKPNGTADGSGDTPEAVQSH